MLKNEEIGQRLRIWGEDRFKDLGEFSKELQVNYSTLQRYLAGKIKIGQDSIIRLIEMGCDIEWLLTGESKYEGTKDNINTVNEKFTEYEQRRISDLLLEIEKMQKENNSLRSRIEHIKKFIDIPDQD